MTVKQATDIFCKVSFKNCIRNLYKGCMSEDELTAITKHQQFLNKGHIVVRMSRKNGVLAVDSGDLDEIKRIVVQDGDRQVWFAPIGSIEEG